MYSFIKHPYLGHLKQSRTYTNNYVKKFGVGLLGYAAMCTCKQISFQRNILPPSSRQAVTHSYEHLYLCTSPYGIITLKTNIYIFTM
jgi:hypothetical protein